MFLQYSDGFVGVDPLSLGDQAVGFILVTVTLCPQRLLDKGPGLRSPVSLVGHACTP